LASSPALFRRVDPEALFYAFYYQPGTYQQYLAAQELKRQSWRYHKHHNAWFQRYAEPSVANDEYEQGTYVYFDFHVVHDDLQSGWCYRRKENFVFRYDALEDELA
jgi:CCR4-NOT transcription complex subunit 3